MRKIKFRIWDCKLNQFVHEYRLGQILEFDQFGFSRIVLPTDFNENLIDYNINNIVYQQFTGLLDKNGKEIYEGDLINFVIPGVAHGPDREVVKAAEVWFSEEDASFVFGKYRSSSGDWWYSMTGDRIDASTIEVIGNVFNCDG